MWVWNAVNQRDTYYIDKNNKLLHWYVSITGLSKKRQQLQGCRSVMELGKWVCSRTARAASNRCQQLHFHGCLLCRWHLPPRAQGRAPWEPVCVSAPSTARGSTLRGLLRAAAEAREPILLLKSIRSKDSNLAIMLTLVNWQLFWNYPAVENSLCFFFEIRT